MKAILIKKPGSYDLVTIDVPQPEHNEVLIQVKATTLCNQHDIKVWTGGYKKLEYLDYGVPGFPGHEGAGEVVQIGQYVNGFSIGDRVVMSGLGGPPLYQEFITRDFKEVVKFSDKLSFEEVAMSELLGCVHRGIQKVKNWNKKTVFISGLGPAGLAAMQIAKTKGASKVIGTDIIENRLKLAQELGADKVYNTENRSTFDQLKKENPQIVYDTTGNTTSYRNSIAVATEAVILFGYTEADVCLDPYPIFDKELTIYGSKWLTVDDLRVVVNLIETGMLKTKPLISAELHFKDYKKAIELIQTGEAIKVVLIP